MPHTNSMSNRNTTSIDSSRRSDGQHARRSSNANATLQRNENEAIKGEKKGEDESHRPDPRMITTARSPSAERSGGLQGQTLPVVEEMGEASSTGGRSGRSWRSKRDDPDGDARPLTPAKDTNDGRPLTPAKDYSPNSNGAVRRPLSRSSLDKELPPLPKVSSPGEMSKKESILS